MKSKGRLYQISGDTVLNPPWHPPIHPLLVYWAFFLTLLLSFQGTAWLGWSLWWSLVNLTKFWHCPWKGNLEKGHWKIILISGYDHMGQSCYLDFLVSNTVSMDCSLKQIRSLRRTLWNERTLRNPKGLEDTLKSHQEMVGFHYSKIYYNKVIVLLCHLRRVYKRSLKVNVDCSCFVFAEQFTFGPRKLAELR